MALVSFSSRADLVALAHNIMFEKSLEITKGVRLHMMLHKKFGDYNADSSLYIGQINPRCNEEDIIQELNALFKAEREERNSVKLNRNQMGKNMGAVKPSTETEESSAEMRHFTLSCIVI